MHKTIVVTALCAALFTHIATAGVVDDLLKGYQAAGAKSFSAANGDKFWHRSHPDPKQAGKTRDCTTCHGTNLRTKGEHARTGKVIKPMAPSVNKDRLTDPKFIEKWF